MRTSERRSGVEREMRRTEHNQEPKKRDSLSHVPQMFNTPLMIFARVVNAGEYKLDVIETRKKN